MTIGTRPAPAPEPSSAPSSPEPSFARAAWITFGSLVAVGTLVYGVFWYVQAWSFERTSTRAVFAADARSLDVRNGAGSTRIVATEADEILVEAKITYGLRKPTDQSWVDGEKLVVRASCSAFLGQWCGVDYTIHVPADVEVLARGSGGGVRVEGIDGAVDVSSSGGGVRVDNVGGQLRLRASGGGISGSRLRSEVVDASSSGGGVRLTFAAPPSEAKVRSSGGGVTVVVPDTGGPYNIRASSSGGSVRTSGVRHDPASPRLIDVGSSGGGVTVRYPDDT
ncbi:hypothetical protein UG55_100777 [Frankia sp. EI5c]|uniref:hypothetical protein n=1 Tax=Frankia sp. EI5c TaxID=683316 RepID=UPI0007C3EF2E|nr:hypothetical protein [Frankia sp. EI5c]OAA27749.1 hypothetical protein UG55_100777 [Frankia sp. EI5c]